MTSTLTSEGSPAGGPSEGLVPSPSPVRRRRGDGGRPLLVGIWIVVAIALVAIPIIGLTIRSLTLDDGSLGIDNYVAVLAREDVLRAIGNSFLVAGSTTFFGLLIAVPLAYLVSRTDMPGRHFFRGAAILTFAAPGFVGALGWILLAGPQNGLLNTAIFQPLGLPSVNIFSPQGIIFVLTFFLYPLIFLPVTDAFDNLDSRMEEAAESLGASRLATLFKVTLPLLVPPIFAGALLVFVGSFLIFGPVALLGSPIGFDTVPTAIFRLMSYPPSINFAAVLAVPVVFLLIGVLFLQRRIYGRRRFTVLNGKPAQRRLVKLGPWAPLASLAAFSVFFISIVMPFSMLIVTSFRRSIGRPIGPENFAGFDNYVAVFQQPIVARAFGNSLLLAVTATAIALAIALLAGWLTERSSWRFRGAVQPVMLMPFAFPSAVLGIALLIAYSGAPLWLGGTLGLIAIAYVIRVLPESYQYVHAGFKQVGPEMDEAARSLGASLGETMRRVTIPLLRGPLLSVAILNFVVLFRELDVSVFLYTGSNPVTSVMLFNLASQSQFQVMGALAVVVLAVNLGVVVVARRFLGMKVRGR